MSINSSSSPASRASPAYPNRIALTPPTLVGSIPPIASANTQQKARHLVSNGVLAFSQLEHLPSSTNKYLWWRTKA